MQHNIHKPWDRAFLAHDMAGRLGTSLPQLGEYKMALFLILDRMILTHRTGVGLVTNIKIAYCVQP